MKIWDFLNFRKGNYQATFSSPAGQEVLRDLAKFCRATDTCFDEDQRRTDVLIGRHEVFRRIADHLYLTTEELYAKLNRGGPTLTKE